MRLRNWSLSGGSRVIQLWHGDGFKNMRIKNLKDWSWDKLPLLLSQPMLFRRYYFYISSSSYTSRTFIEPSFYANSSEVKSLGLPRYDVLYEEVKGQNIDIHRELKEKVASVRNSGARKLILYAPTFRRGEDPDFPLTPVNLEVINNFLKERHFFLFVSLHPKFAIDQSLTSLTNIISIPSDFDKYPLFHEFDAVITDYSSTCIEFLLISKPTIFYSYDLEKYLENPGVHKEIWNDFPGPRVKSLDELLSCLDKIDLIWTDNHEIMKKTIYPPQDANS
jgi:CDP-glycerol glycerophosphotransferase